MKKIGILLASTLLALSLFAQEKTEKPSIKLGGFIDYSMFFDSRETVSAIDGIFLLYPKNENIVDGIDINDNPSFTMLALVSRLNTKITGPEILGAKSSAFIEADFSLYANATTVRFRHAFVKLAWEKTSVLAGRTWHPMFTTDCFPSTLSIATGAPFNPFSRTPQIKVSYNAGSFNFQGAIISQMDYSSFGPNGKSPSYSRNALVPEFTAQIKYQNENFLIGLIGEVKTIKPRTTIIGTSGITTKAEETLTTYSGKLFSKYKKEKLEVKASLMYSQNMTDAIMIGGYGVATYDSVTGKETYTSLSGINSWLNIIYGKKLKVGIFGGYFQNLGSADEFYSANLLWSRGSNIDHLYRIMPALTYQMKNLRVGIEFEYNIAGYGTSYACVFCLVIAQNNFVYSDQLIS